ncbi:MAG: SRPBCC domain-containing protein [Abditibacteriaceae bacterium]
MSEKESSVASEPEEKVLSITRVFDAPRHLVFEAWTKAEHLKKWLSPEGFTVQSSEGDVRPDGAWRSSMRNPDGELIKMDGVYREIVPNEKLVFTHAWDEETGGSGHETVITVTFADQDGKTRMNFHQAFFLAKETRDAHVGGWSQCFDKLSELLSELEA